MKRTITLLAFCGFFLSLAFGYYFTVQEQEKYYQTAEEEKVITAAKKEVTVKKGGQLVYQYFYTKDAITKEKNETVPDFLEGMTMEQMQSVYNGWRIVYFAPKKVVLRCIIEGKSTEVYMLGKNEGYLAVFYEDEEKMMRLKEQTDVPVSLLPEGEQRQLEEGIFVLGEENLVKLLSDFSS